MSKFNWTFKLGRERMKFKDWVKMSIILNVSLDTLALIPGLTRKNVFNFIDYFSQKYNVDSWLNDFVIADEELLSYRVERVVDKALKEHNEKS